MSWVDIQKKTFQGWCNEYLKERGMHINDFSTDFKDGILLVNLLEVISGKKLPKHNKNPRIPSQKLENNVIALNFIQSEGIKLVNIGPEDLTDGRLKLVLGLIWTLILRYQINMIGSDNNSAKNELLKWVQSKIPEYNIKGFTKDWNDGRALCGLVNALQPGLSPDHQSLDPTKKRENAAKGIDLAYNAFDIPKIIAPEDLNDPRVDELSVMTYISYFRNAQPTDKKWADKCSAWGPGLVEAVQNEDTHFSVLAPSGAPETLEIKVEGPKTDAKPKITKTKNPDGTTLYQVEYKPTEPGEWKIHVTLDGNHIPGSIFTVRVLEAVSLGGEGKIRVFFSTTSSSEKGRNDVVDLQKLLERKKIHLRPDFEPWVPVDIMEKVDRDAVFKKAGTRALPIVFIDDKYTGDFDRMAELDKSGQLDLLLKYNEKK